MTALRTSFGASTKPASAYRPISSATIAAIRKVFVLMNCRKEPPRYRSPILPLIALDQAFAFANLTGRQGVTFSGERVVITAKRHSDRGAHQVKRLAIDVDQIAPVSIRHMVGLVAVNDHDRRGLGSLVGVALLDAAPGDHGPLRCFHSHLPTARHPSRAAFAPSLAGA